jgi:hypothetical protein
MRNEHLLEQRNNVSLLDQTYLQFQQQSSNQDIFVILAATVVAACMQAAVGASAQCTQRCHKKQ